MDKQTMQPLSSGIGANDISSVKVTAPIDEALWLLAKSDLTIDELFNQLASRRISLIISDQ
jgi:hypothetical protein